MKKFLLLFGVMAFLAGLIGIASADLLVDASLRNGDYGGGTTPDPYHPSNDPSQTCPGIENSPNGVTYTDPKALINWNFSAAAADSLRYQGTICFTATFDRNLFTNNYQYLLCDNKGYDTFHNGQASFSAWATRTAPGQPDDQILLAYRFWIASYSAKWYYIFSTNPNNRLSFDQPHKIGFTWGGPYHDFEIWADGVLITAGSLPAGASFPWGTNSSGWDIAATNMGLGDNIKRGVKPSYGSAIGVTFADLQIWNEYRPMGGTKPLALNVSIDIKPGSSDNSINPKSQGTIPVAILSTPDFSAPDKVKLSSLTFGQAGDEASLAFCTVEDVNGDGVPDVVGHFYTQAALFQTGDTKGYLKGKTTDNIDISGNDAVRIVPPAK